MASWLKLLAKMAADPNPTTYTYQDAARVLGHLGFALAPHGGTSHRRWRRRDGAAPPVVVGLVDTGSGPIKKVYIVQMIDILRTNNLLPEGVE